MYLKIHSFKAVKLVWFNTYVDLYPLVDKVYKYNNVSVCFIFSAFKLVLQMKTYILKNGDYYSPSNHSESVYD